MPPPQPPKILSERELAELCEEFLRSFQRSDEEMERILNLPQRSQEWRDLRKYILSASRFAAALNKSGKDSQDKLLLEMLEGTSFQGNWATMFGTALEPKTEWAVALGVKQIFIDAGYRHVHIVPTGLKIFKDYPFLAASADGILYATGPELPTIVAVLEHKNPYTLNIYPEVPEKHWIQFHGQAHAWGCNAIVYNVSDLHQTEMNFFTFCKDVWEKEYLPGIVDFYVKKFVPMLMLKRHGLIEDGSIKHRPTVSLPAITLPSFRPKDAPPRKRQRTQYQ